MAALISFGKLACEIAVPSWSFDAPIRTLVVVQTNNCATTTMTNVVPKYRRQLAMLLFLSLHFTSFQASDLAHRM